MDATGRLRLDAVARFIQDIAIDDVQETGWELPDHLWSVRSIVVDVIEPFRGRHRGRVDDLVQRCRGDRGRAALVGERRRGGRIEVDSVWIHLDSEQRPARIENFGVYGDAAAGRHVSTRLSCRILHPTPRARGGHCE